MRSNRFSLLVSLAVLLFCAACASQPDRRGPPPGERSTGGANYTGMAAKPVGLLFATMDQNRDAIVDSNELDLGIADEWDRLSSTAFASALEFETWSLLAFGSNDTLPSFIAFDHDLDGRFTIEDFSKRLQFEFERLDTDNSGTLVRSELLFRISRPSRGSGDSGQGERGRGGGGGEGRGRPRQ